MRILDAVKLVRVVALKGKQYAMIDFDQWEALVEKIEDIEDASAVNEVYAELAKAGGDKRKAGWITWEEAERELDALDQIESKSARAKSSKKPSRPYTRPRSQSNRRTVKQSATARQQSA